MPQAKARWVEGFQFVGTPPSKALVNSVPRAIVLRQQAPLGPATGDPEHRFQEPAAVGDFPDPTGDEFLTGETRIDRHQQDQSQVR